VNIANLNAWGLAGTPVTGTVVLDESRGVYEWDGTQWSPVVKNDCGTQISGISGTQYWTGYFGVAGCWMTENLAETQYATGVDIVRGGLAINNVTTYDYAAYISTPGDDATTMGSDDVTRLTNVRNSDYYSPGAGKPGLLYSWVAATGGGSDQSEGDIASGSAASSPGRRVQGACPDGWHVPNDYEWNLLEKEIYIHPTAYAADCSGLSSLEDNAWTYDAATTYRPSTGTTTTYPGRQMKSIQAVNSTASNGNSKAATANGFNALLVGNAGGSWANYGTNAAFWSSSSVTTSYGWYRDVASVISGERRSADTKNNRYSLRCKKD
jgi:uncharacterized protein (TIGR02145 family)